MYFIAFIASLRMKPKYYEYYGKHMTMLLQVKVNLGFLLSTVYRASSKTYNK